MLPMRARRAQEEIPREALTDDWSFFEPTGGAGSVAMLVSESPHVFQVDVGANGYYDASRWVPRQSFTSCARH